jgi:hypothetical protein
MVALSRAGAFVMRNNSGLFFTHTGRRVRASMPGAADIIAVHQGRALAVECKTATGRQLPAQRNFQAAWERAGGVYIIVRSAADVLDALDSTAST